MQYPKISIVTPVLNQVNYIDDAILSVIGQGYPNLEYIIIDGGSTDGTLDVIKKHEKHLTYWISEPDNGMYHALQKGFDVSTGIIMGWINADDMLHKKSLFALALLFGNKQKEVNWVQGYPTVYDINGITIGHNTHVFSKYQLYSQNFSDGEFIQQESTFWHRALWKKSGAYISEDYKFAGDFELWIRFFRYDALFCTNSLLGGYRISPNQLSRQNYQSYLSECEQIISKENLNALQQKNLKKIIFLKRVIKNFSWLKFLLQRKLHHLYGDKKMINLDSNSGKIT